ncbi:PKD domain-containing protein, partial [Schleiferiaceae bacterium]|nr:PKD domain-containing protein [Schleiferiaceae bacterium]
DPDDEDHIVISISGYAGNRKVMESFNAGSTWTNLSSGLPNVPATAVAFEGGSSDGIYVGTDIGMYYTSSNFPSWISFNKNLPNVIISDIEVYEDDALIRIGTYGRGVWQSPLMSGFTGPPVAAFVVDPINICSTSDTVVLTDLSTDIPTTWSWQITPSTITYVGGTNDSSQNPKVIFNNSGSYTISLSVSNNYGVDDTTMYQYVKVGGYELPFIENFESSISDWEITNPDGGITWSSTPVNGTSPGVTAMVLDHFSYNAIGQTDELISPPLNFSNDTLITLEYQYAYTYFNSSFKDSLKVFVSTDCGFTWDLVATYDGSLYATRDTSSLSFTPADSMQWCHGNSNVNCPSIDLNAYSGMSGIRVKFQAINGYGNNLYIDNINISGQSVFPPSAAFGGDSINCINHPLQFFDYSNPTPGARLWSFQGGTPSTSTSANPVVTYSTPGTYDVKLVVSNAAGVDSVVMPNYVTIVSAPVADIILTTSGSTTLCNGDSATFTATPTNGGLNPTINWILNGTVVSSNTFTYSGTFVNNDVLKVEMLSSDDCVANPSVADSLTLTVNSLPTVTLGSQGYVCELDGPQLLSGGQPLGGVYSGSGIVNDSIYPSTAGVGSHWVYYTYTDATTGCSKTKQRAISVQPAPGKPTVSQNTTGELEAATPAGTFTYEWLDANMDPISGATGATFLPQSNGDYYVRIFSNILCSNMSDVYGVVNIGFGEALTSGWSVYPNPAQKVLTIRIEGSADVRLLDAAGRLAYKGTISGEANLDVENWARGTYVLQIITNSGIENEAIVLH